MKLWLGESVPSNVKKSALDLLETALFGRGLRLPAPSVKRASVTYTTQEMMT